MYLLDTNVVSELRRARPHGAVLAWMGSVAPGDLHVSAVTIGEIQAGVEKTRGRDPAKAGELEAWLESLAAVFSILPMDSACFRSWARLMHGRSDEYYEDAMIAATALTRNLIVATRDVKDFAALGARIVNPFAAPQG